MKQIELVKIIQDLFKKHQKKIFSLREISAYAGLSRADMGMSLIRGAENGILWRVKNLWINQLNPPSLEEVALSLISPSYISFESALYAHHILSQSPRGGVTLATPARSAVIETPLGVIRAIHLKKELFWGYDIHRMALPEKAWLDLLYIRSRKGLENSEVFYPDRLNRKKMTLFAKKYPGSIWKKTD